MGSDNCNQKDGKELRREIWWLGTPKGDAKQTLETDKRNDDGSSGMDTEEPDDPNYA